MSAVMTTIIGVFPVFLFGGMAPLIRRDLGFDARWIGILVALYFATSAVGSVYGGWLGERLDSRRALWIGLAISGMSLAGLALAAHDLTTLAVLLALGGIGNAVIQPAANLSLARGVAVTRRGMAFGIKQSAIPAASATGGFAVPLLGVTVGWRVAFGAAAVLALVVASLPPPGRRAPAPASSTSRRRGYPPSLYLLACGIGLGTAGANSVGAYLVESSVADGLNPATAGAILGIGGAFAAVVRVSVGWASDRLTRGHLVVVAAMMFGGAFGYAGIALASVPIAMLLAVALAFGAGWGYNGLFVYAVVRLNPDAPAAATGIAQAGAFGGSVVGPMLFGLVAAATSYNVAWAATGMLSLAAGALILLARRRVRYERQQR